MKTYLLLFFLITLSQLANAQKLVSRNSHIWFYSHTPVEDIEAHNRQAVSILDPVTGELLFNVLIKSFEFKIALMQEHFNENYLESDQYPKAVFNGKITNNAAVNYKKDGTYQAEVAGDLTIHNVTRPVLATGTIEVKSGMVKAMAKFTVKPADYNITIPAVVEKNIAREVDVYVDASYPVN